MGQHKHNPNAIAAQSGQLPPKSKQMGTRERDYLVLAWSFQICFDALTLVLNDPKSMGKDVFGRNRLKKLCADLKAKTREILPGLSYGNESSHVRAQVDRELQKIYGEDFTPWQNRYELWDDRGI